MITWKDYLAFVKSKMGAHKNAADPIDYAFVGLIGEVGELVNIIKKIEYHHDRSKLSKIPEESGDCFFYLVALMDFVNADPSVLPDDSSTHMELPQSIDLQDMVRGLLKQLDRLGEADTDYIHEDAIQFTQLLMAVLKRYGFNLQVALQNNIDKLNARYPNGYTDDASKNRTV